MLLWCGVGIGALLLIWAGTVWRSDDKSAEKSHQAAAADAPAAVGASANSAPPADVPADAAVAATISDEAATPMAAAGPAPAGEGNTTSLVDMLNAPPPQKMDAELLKAALEGSADKGGKSRPAKLASSTAQPAPKPKPPAAPRKAQPKAEPDSDLTLLTALVAHTQATRAEEAGTGVDGELKACRQSKGEQARQCRMRACTGHWKTNANCMAIDKAKGRAPAADS